MPWFIWILWSQLLVQTCAPGQGCPPYAPHPDHPAKSVAAFARQTECEETVTSLTFPDNPLNRVRRKDAEANQYAVTLTKPVYWCLDAAVHPPNAPVWPAE